MVQSTSTTDNASNVQWNVGNGTKGSTKKQQRTNKKAEGIGYEMRYFIL
jgi:hypothetical protein